MTQTSASDPERVRPCPTCDGWMPFETPTAPWTKNRCVACQSRPEFEDPELLRRRRRSLGTVAVGCLAVIGVAAIVIARRMLEADPSRPPASGRVAPHDPTVPTLSPQRDRAVHPPLRGEGAGRGTAARDRNVVGRWIDSIPTAYAHRIEIYREGGRVFLERTMLSDGSSGREEVVESETSAGLRFDPARRSATGDHYLVVSSGALELRDARGLVLTVPKSEQPK